MNRITELQEVLKTTSIKPQSKWQIIFWGFVVIGIVSFGWNLFFGKTHVAWESLLVNVIFFASVVYGALIFSVIATVTDSYWFRPIKRIAELISTFGIVCLLLFGVLFLGIKFLYAWSYSELALHTKEAWLNYKFFVIRQTLGLVFLGFLSFVYLKNSIRPDLGLSKTLGFNFNGFFAKRWLADYSDQEQESERAYNRNRYLAPWLAATYAVVFSFIAFDWMMSLDQHWFSTMFGVQYCLSGLAGAGALLMIFSRFLNKNLGQNEYQTVSRHKDLSRLTFAACLVWNYMLFAQVLVIWYANLPEETPFLILRIVSDQWGIVSRILLVLLFVVPFFGLMTRAAASSFNFAIIIAPVILAGFWLEKFLLIVPAVQENVLSISALHGHSVDTHVDHHLVAGFEIIPFLHSIFVGIGLFGAFGLWISRVIQKFPLMPVADNRFYKSEH